MQYTMCHCRNKPFIFLSLWVCFFGTFVSAHAQMPDKGYSETVEAFRHIVRKDKNFGQYYEGLIQGLSYTKKRALRAFSRLDNVSSKDLVLAVRRLVTETIAFDNLLLLEHFVTLQESNIDNCWQFLEKLSGLDYSSGRVMTAFKLVENITATELLGYVDRIKRMDAPAGWALKAYLELSDQNRDSVVSAMDILEQMSEKQQWAVEQCCGIKEMKVGVALEAMSLLRCLSNTDAWNALGLFKQKINPDSVLIWLTQYFTVDQQRKEEMYFLYPPKEKALLLDGLAEASDYLTWKINDLHSITDLRGQEISSGTLNKSSITFLDMLWKRLDGNVREQYRSSFYKPLRNGKKGSAIRALRRATAKARVQAAHDMTTANIYILLSKGSELYDSSFRDILVPVLKDRIDDKFGENLLRFLLEVDPENDHVSDFIISLAQRGKLAVFFPDAPREQEQVLDLVTNSAFQDENSLILFSATFMKLLETIEPATRTYLIGNMLSAIRKKNTIFAMQLRVILQYYLEYYSEFVSQVDRIRIRMMMYEYGAIPLQLYTKTAFTEWKSDGLLSSLSVFHDDDDGRQSYLSNCHYLRSHGYRPKLSTSFVFDVSTEILAKTASVLSSYPGSPSQSILALYRLQSDNPLVLDWVKKIGDITVSHSVFVFQGKAIQENLLKQFLTGGHEMFAQRGHSYWRTEQLIEPITQLLEKKLVTTDELMSKQRFMSLGSCGGIRAYSQLASLFNNNVDILATVGTGKAVINNPYNQFLFEAVAKAQGDLSWDDVAEKSSRIFKQGLGEDYLQPGSLPAILHKIMDQKIMDHATD